MSPAAAVERCLNSRYQYMLKARSHMKDVTSRYRTLTAKADTFIFNDGSSKELVSLCGTIPVRYKGSTYNIPVRIWILDTHPYHAPLCFVCPTSSMRIKTSCYVDESGRIYLPYLHEWNQNHSDLVSLVEVMITVFAQAMPLFSKPPGLAGHTFTQPEGSARQPVPYPPADPFPMPRPRAAITAPGVTTPASEPPAAGTPGLSEEHIHMSLLTAVVNRITMRAAEFEQKSDAEEQVLRKTHEELVAGRQKLNRYMTDMERDCKEMDSNVALLREKNEQLKQAIEQMSDVDKGAVDVDSAVTPTAPLYRQLLQVYAEESAVEDTIYYLGEGLRKGVIDLDAFLKHVRELSRKQFMLRALMQKCRQKAGLPPV